MVIIVCYKCLMGASALVGFSDCFGQKKNSVIMNKTAVIAVCWKGSVDSNS
jgi:hypothetical protein